MPADSVRFALVCAAYRCPEWVVRCVESIRAQTHKNFRCVLIDDCSPDGTFENAQKAAGNDERFTLLRNEARRSTLPNLLAATKLAAQNEDDVVCVVDGDDALRHDGVLAHLAKIYADPNVWLTYGSAEVANKPLKARLLGRTVRGNAAPYPAAVRERNLYRYHPGGFLATHLRSYRRFLWDAIRDADLRDEDGEYFRVGADNVTMWPMLEMATDKHIRYVDELLYLYNNDHALSDNRQKAVWSDSDQYRVNVIVRSRPAYAPLQR